MANPDKLPSGSWRARWQYKGKTESLTFKDRKLAHAAVALASVEPGPKYVVYAKVLGLPVPEIIPDQNEALLLSEYARKWIDGRDLKPRSLQEYNRNLRLHIAPFLGDKAIIAISTQDIRTWRLELLKAVGKPTVAKCYRILHAMFATAVDEDELLARNPCSIRGASYIATEERKIATPEQVFAIANAIQPRYRLMVLLATFAQLRFGELVGLRRSAIDLAACELHVEIATGELDDGTRYDDDPKSRAGKRPVAFPGALVEDIELHLATFAQSGAQGRLFVGRHGGIPRRRNFNRVWKAALRAAGVPAETDFHFHDLRHTGGTWSAQTGATLKDVMARTGHSSTRAALIYQHATRERDQMIAAGLNAIILQLRPPGQHDLRAA